MLLAKHNRLESACFTLYIWYTLLNYLKVPHVKESPSMSRSKKNKMKPVSPSSIVHSVTLSINLNSG